MALPESRGTGGEPGVMTSASSWVSDLLPHLAYGLTTAAVFDMISAGRRS